jgi:hypothetical protein
MRIIPEAAIDLYEYQIDAHHELRLGPDQVHALFNMARAYLATPEGKMAQQQRSLPFPAEPQRKPPRVQRIVVAA